MNVVVRKAIIGDLKTIQDFNHALFLFDIGRDPELNANWPHEQDGEAYFTKMINEENGICFVAEVNGKVAGYLAGCMRSNVPSYRPVKRSELENMFVAEEYRRMGVGSKLAEEFITWSKSKGAAKVYVSAYVGNEKAINFYQKVGFKPRCLELETDC